MYLLYIDESGTADVPGTTSHFVLAGLSIPVWKWSVCDEKISRIKKKYALTDSEIHTGWLLRRYVEQELIPGFESLSYDQRRREVERARNTRLLTLQKQSANGKGSYHQEKKNYVQTAAYIHLTFDERKKVVEDVAREVGSWGFARLFADCIDKTYYDPIKHRLPISEQALEQLVSRFQRYLVGRNKGKRGKQYGMLIHDNNLTIAKKHTSLMKTFHERGTFWGTLEHIIETPLFVDSSLTSMVQVADLCSYAIRRYVENGEDTLLDLILPRAHNAQGRAVTIRHFASDRCTCKICIAHGKSLPLFSKSEAHPDSMSLITAESSMLVPIFRLPDRLK